MYDLTPTKSLSPPLQVHSYFSSGLNNPQPVLFQWHPYTYSPPEVDLPSFSVWVIPISPLKLSAIITYSEKLFNPSLLNELGALPAFPSSVHAPLFSIYRNQLSLFIYSPSVSWAPSDHRARFYCSTALALVRCPTECWSNRRGLSAKRPTVVNIREQGF